MADKDVSGEAFAVFAIAVVAALALMAGFIYLVSGGNVPTSPSREAAAIRAAEQYGLTNVHDVYACFLCCSRDDTIRLRFVATGRDGAEVKGQACAGLLFKSWTIRTE